jgi:hypothetical protein
VGPRALARLHAGGAAGLGPETLRIGLGLAWAAGDVKLVRAALASLPSGRIDADPVLLAFQDVTRPV